jgi:predicted lipid-binding transport protein (Tim44 family)
MSVEITRRGGKYEAGGCLLIGLGVMMFFLAFFVGSAGAVTVSSVMLMIGFVIFLIGRFM